MHDEYEVGRLFEDGVRHLDNEGIYQLRGELHHSHPPGNISEKELKLHARMNHLIVARHRESGFIVGMATLLIYQDFSLRMGRIHEVVVARAHQRKGIAESMVRKIIETARQEDLCGLKLTSSDARAEAHRLYEKLGFVNTGPTNHFRLQF